MPGLAALSCFFLVVGRGVGASDTTRSVGLACWPHQGFAEMLAAYSSIPSARALPVPTRKERVVTRERERERRVVVVVVVLVLIVVVVARDACVVRRSSVLRPPPICAVDEEVSVSAHQPHSPQCAAYSRSQFP